MVYGSISRKEALERNLVLFPWFYGLQMLTFIGPMIVIFFLANGLNYTQIFVLEALYGIVIVACELPTGMFADKYGRVKSLVASTVLILLGIIAYARGSSFAGFLLAETLWGVGASFGSGAEEALLYDSLKELRRSKEYKKMMGKAMTIFYGCAIVSALVGGIVAQRDLHLPFYLATAVYIVMLIVSLYFTEPSYHRSALGHIAHITASVRHFWKKTKVRWLILYQATTISALLIMFWTIQPYFKLLGIPLSLFGVYFAGFSCMGLLASRYAHRIEAFLGIKKSLFLMGLTLVVGFAVLGLVPALLSTVWFFLMELVWGYSTPVIGDYLNRVVPSHQRATILSIGSLLTRFIFAIFGPLFGKLADTKGIPSTLVIIGAVFSVFFFLLLVTFNSHNINHRSVKQ